MGRNRAVNLLAIHLQFSCDKRDTLAFWSDFGSFIQFVMLNQLLQSTFVSANQLTRMDLPLFLIELLIPYF